MSIQYRQKEVVCLFVHVDRLNKRETFDAHCINVCHRETKKNINRNGKTKRNSESCGKILLSFDCDLSFVRCIFFWMCVFL